MNEIFKKLSNNKNYLILANILLVFFLILLKNINILPINNTGNFIFFTFLILVFTLYRPGWSFLFFIGTIILENINIAPVEIGINVRPYQFFAALVIIAVIIRLLAKRSTIGVPKWIWIDFAPLVFVIGSFLSALYSNNIGSSLKLSFVVVSFVAIYYLVRVYIQNLEDLKKILPFFLSTGIIVVLYGIWQNWRYLHGFSHFEVMPGRPNSTFTEPDWLGIFLVLLAGCLYTMLYCNLKNDVFPPSLKKIITSPKFIFLYIYLALVYILTIITVSRSAWLGIFCVTFIYLLALANNYSLKLHTWRWKESGVQLILIIVIIIISSIYVYALPLTNFQLFNRAQSVGSGLQKITISCRPNLDCAVPAVINNTSELENCYCRHINLEEINTEKAAGNLVSEIYRTDPNVSIRSQIYQKSWQKIKKNPVFGIGWGNIGGLFGKDERGATLNSSNIFLEAWLGAGIIGLASIILIWVYIMINSVKFFLHSKLVGRVLGLFLLLGVISFIIPNLFNAGIMMGILWLFFGISSIKTD